MIPSCFESQLDVDFVGPALALAQVAAVQPCSAVFSDDLDHIGSPIIFDHVKANGDKRYRQRTEERMKKHQKTGRQVLRSS